MHFRRALPLVLLASTLTLPAHAVSKEMVQLMTQVQQLQDAVARLQQSNDERMGVMKDLVQQTADSVNRMSVTVGGLQQALTRQNADASTKVDQLSGQIQSLNDTLDELRARMAKMDRALASIDSQQQQLATSIQNQTPGNSPASNSGDNLASAQPAPIVNGRGNSPAPPAGPSAQDLYRTAYGDYMGAKYPLAAQEFADLIKAYPDDNLAGNAYFYLGEINNKNVKPSLAVKDYDLLIERYPDNKLIPAAHLHKGQTLISMKQPDAGVRELKSLIQRFPNSPEAAQARTKLNAVSGSPRR